MLRVNTALLAKYRGRKKIGSYWAKGAIEVSVVDYF